MNWQAFRERKISTFTLLLLIDLSGFRLIKNTLLLNKINYQRGRKCDNNVLAIAKMTQKLKKKIRIPCAFPLIKLNMMLKISVM